jgi:hypothetical protein
MTTIKIINTETGEETEREMNAAELEQQAIDQAAEAARKAAQTAKVADKAALLVKLGITEDEARLLLS